MKRSFAHRVLLTLLSITALLLILHVAMQYLNLEVYKEKQGQIFELSNRVDFDDEVSLPTWFSQFILLSTGISALLVARLERHKSHKKVWGLIGILGILFSIDEVGSIHEFVLQSAHLLYYGEVVPTAALNAWWLAAPFIITGGLLFLWWIIRVLPKSTWTAFFAGGCMYIIGAAGFELFSNDFSKMSFMYQGVMTGIEETFEMLGSIVVLYTVLKYLETHHIEKIRSAVKSLRNA